MSRGGPRAHFLLAGDGSDLGRLQDAAARLPFDAYGQVFVEVASPIQIQDLAVPEGLTVSWLCRQPTAWRSGQQVPRGALIVQAIRAWLAEWMPEQRSAHALPYVLWIGCAASDRVNRLYEELAFRCRHVELQSPPEP